MFAGNARRRDPGTRGLPRGRRPRAVERPVAEDSVEGSPGIAGCLDIVAERLDGVAATVERPDFDGVPALVARIARAIRPAADVLGPPGRRPGRGRLELAARSG